MDVCLLVAWTHWSDLCQCPYWGFTVKKTFVYSLHTAQDNSNWKQNVTHTLDPHLQERRCILVNTLSSSRSRGVLRWTLGSSYRFYLHSSGSEEPPAPAETWTGDVQESVSQVQANVGNADTETVLTDSKHRAAFCSHTATLSLIKLVVSQSSFFVTLDDTSAGRTVMLWDSLLNHLAYLPTNRPPSSCKTWTGEPL